jgi:hypothetical protein
MADDDTELSRPPIPTDPNYSRPPLPVDPNYSRPSLDQLPSIGPGGATGQPMNTSTPASQAADPAAGAGWKQGVRNVSGVFNDTLGRLQANGGKVGVGPAPGAPAQGVGGGAPTLAQQAQALLQKGAISQQQYQQIMSRIGGPVPSTGMPEMIASQQPGGASPPQQPTQPPMGPANPLGPTSQAWGS